MGQCVPPSKQRRRPHPTYISRVTRLGAQPGGVHSLGPPPPLPPLSLAPSPRPLSTRATTRGPTSGKRYAPCIVMFLPRCTFEHAQCGILCMAYGA